MRSLNKTIVYAAASVALGLVTIAGCSSGSNGNPYPTANPVADSGPVTPAPLIVPSGAVTKAEAVYGLISFSLDGPGLLYITDETANNTVIASTSPAADMIGRSLSMADLRNVTHQLDTTHRYLISFVPQHMMMPSTVPTTAP